jgi:hypothetical protein
MRWTKKEPRIGDERTRKYFAWLPVKCENGTTYWLESVGIYERYSYTLTYGFAASRWVFMSYVALEDEKSL